MSRPPRLENFDYIGRHHYFLTICTHERKPCFADTRNVDLFTEQLLRSSRECDMAINVYCAMPDHVHILALGVTDAADLKRFVHGLKQKTGWRFRLERGPRLWQEGYYDHVLREEEGTAGVIAYIVSNPVRDGLAAAPLEYPFWGSLTHSREQIVDLIVGAADWQPGDP